MSQYRGNFCLKGSTLLFAHNKFKSRPTKDIDFLGDRINRDKESIKKRFVPYNAPKMLSNSTMDPMT